MVRSRDGSARLLLLGSPLHYVVIWLRAWCLMVGIVGHDNDDGTSSLSLYLGPVHVEICWLPLSRRRRIEGSES